MLYTCMYISIQLRVASEQRAAPCGGLPRDQSGHRSAGVLRNCHLLSYYVLYYMSYHIHYIVLYYITYTIVYTVYYIMLCLIHYTILYYAIRYYTPSPPTKRLDFRGSDSSRLLILRDGNSHVR